MKPIKQDVKNSSRREAIQSIGKITAGVTAALMLGEANASDKVMSMSESEHIYSSLIDDTQDCIKTGNLCLDHCIELVAQDDTSIAACISTVRAMLPALASLLTLASANSKHVSAMAKVCIDLCEDCRVECEKHAHHHLACKTCMESCERCIKACKAVA